MREQPQIRFVMFRVDRQWCTEESGGLLVGLLYGKCGVKMNCAVVIRDWDQLKMAMLFQRVSSNKKKCLLMNLCE
jgi:hypothetical protein